MNPAIFGTHYPFRLNGQFNLENDVDLHALRAEVGSGFSLNLKRNHGGIVLKIIGFYKSMQARIYLADDHFA